MKVVILAGGFGTRLDEVTDSIPKPMVMIGSKPIIVHIMEIYASYGHTDFYLALGYKAEIIRKYFKDNKLIFYNAFDYESPEDILYYLLFCLSQLNLDVEKTHVLCYGDINLDYKLYNLLYTYIRNIELIDSEEVDGVDNNILRSNILLSKF